MVNAVFFDMNETLLDLNLLQQKFQYYFTDPYALKYWFVKLLHSSTVMASMNEYADFGKLSRAVLEDLAVESQVNLKEADIDSILSSFKSLSAYDDVVPALSLLKDNNIRTVAVSNSSKDMMKMQLQNSGLIDLFDSYYSTDSVNTYKPFKQIYQFVAEQEKLKLDEIYMVASHDWDLFGAQKAGLKTAYIKRKHEIYNPYYPKADISGDDLIEVADLIIDLNI
ncbi:MAG: haloacid dehalogenase type II [Sphaerochaetaceae bacterium]|nr:haloacid dehalogenase type II [Sphaerochaetaceae bacterium]